MGSPFEGLKFFVKNGKTLNMVISSTTIPTTEYAQKKTYET